MQFNNSNIIVYQDDIASICNVGEILTRFECKPVTSDTSGILEYNVLDDIYVNTLNSANKLEFTRVNKVYHQTDNVNLSYININDDVNFLSNIVCFNNKQKTIFVQPADNLEKKYPIQNDIGLQCEFINKYKNLELDQQLGYLVGYWLLRGGFFKIDKKNEEYPSWSGRESDINKLKNIVQNHTSLVKSFKENLQLLLLLESEYNDFFRNNFIQNSNKTNSVKKLPDWILIAKQEFLQGLFYGLIAGNSYISNDSKGNFYLAIKVSNPNIISLLHDIFKIRFGIYSRIIGDNNHLSFKFNGKLHSFVYLGISKKFICIDNFEDIVPIINKEIIFNNFKVIPWYKFKNNINNLTASSAYSLGLANGETTIMLSNGLFTTC